MIFKKENVLISLVLVSLVFTGAVKYFDKIPTMNDGLLTSSSQAIVELTDKERGYVKGELLLKFKNGVSSEKQRATMSRWGMNSVRELPNIGVKVINVPAGAEKSLRLALSKNPNIEFVELNGVLSALYVPNDTEYPVWHHATMHSEAAWDISRSSDATIAILDSGVEATHPDLAASLITGWNTVSNNSDTSPVMYHGTRTAGSAAAIGDNNNQAVGVSYDAKIMPIRVTNSTDGSATWADIAEGVVYAADRGVKIASISYGICTGSSTMNNAADYMKSKGGLVFGGTGNSGTNLGYANNTHIICVGATQNGDTISTFSSYGPYVDLVAPGTSIKTTTTGGGTVNASGTSYSTPIVAGLASLIWSIDMNFTPEQVESILKESSVDLGPVGWDEKFGTGRVDALAALTMATQMKGPEPDTTNPQVQITNPTNGVTVENTVNININASDNIAVTKTELWINGTRYSTDNNSPYSFVWDTNNTQNGSVSLQARSYDAAGNVGVSSISVNVLNASDSVSPSVSITSPSEGSSIPTKGSLVISSSASDNVGVTQIDILFDGRVRDTCYDSTTCSVSLNVRKISNGTHVIKTIAIDAMGNEGTEQITITKGDTSSGGGDSGDDEVNTKPCRGKKCR